MTLTRRTFLLQASSASLAFAGLGALASRVARGGEVEPGVGPFGPLVPDPAGVFDLPKGFRCRVLSRTGDAMGDGLLTPGKPDGMGCFPDQDGTVLLLRNHEIIANEGPGAFGKDAELLARVDASMLYDAGRGMVPLGGVTALRYDPRAGRVVDSWLALAGTNYNCAGGATPWGTWLTCEENVADQGEGFLQNHGYVFEVPARRGLHRAVPIRAMGRFRHEAVCIDPSTGVVYLTEDRDDALIYRFLPRERTNPHAGGKLQALKLKVWASAETRNWDKPLIKVGDSLEVEWIDLTDVEPAKDDLRARGFAQGAARFARTEGAIFDAPHAYFAATSGGPSKTGQVWRYTPSPREGTPEEPASPGSLTLLVESPGAATMNMCDNLCVAPSGGLLVCEDSGTPVNRLLHVTPAGEVGVLGRNAFSQGELAGACFSPDGSVLFLNIQSPGLTLAIDGPWRG